MPIPKPHFPMIDYSSHLARDVGFAYAFSEGYGSSLKNLVNGFSAGTLTNMDPATDWVGSSYGYSLDFDGTLDFIQAPSSLITDTPFTVFVLAKSDVTSGIKYLIANGGETSKSGFAIYQNSLTVELYVKSDSNNTQGNISAASKINNNWQTFAGTFDGTTDTNAIKLYVDGVQVAQGTAGSGAVSAANNLRVCAPSGSSSFTWDGQVSLAIGFNRVLSQNEIAYLNWDPFIFLRFEDDLINASAGTISTASQTAGFFSML